MSPGGFLSLLAATAISAIAAGVAVLSQPPSGTAYRAGETPMFPAFNERIEDLEHVTIDHPAYLLRLDRSDEGWVASGRGHYPVKADLVANLAASLAAMTPVEPKTSNPDWQEYIRVRGPDAPPQARGIQIAAIAGDGAILADVVIGRQSASIGYSPLGGTFVRPSDQAQAWLVEGTVSLPAALSDWFDGLFHIPGPDIARIAILSGDEVVYDAEKVDFESGDYALTHLSSRLGPTTSTVNLDALRNLTQAVVSVEFEDVRPREGVFLGTDARTVRFVTRDGLTIEATLGEAEGRTWTAFEAGAAPGSEAVDVAAAIQSRVEDWAFQLPERRVMLLDSPLNTLFDLPPGASEAPAAVAPPSLPGPLQEQP